MPHNNKTQRCFLNIKYHIKAVFLDKYVQVTRTCVETRISLA